MSLQEVDATALFSMYMQVTGVPTLAPEKGDEPGLTGKALGIINGASWTSLWSTWFGRRILPGVKLVNVGNEAVQLSFMKAHQEGREVPPQSNIDAFVRYARDLADLYPMDAIIITCSTMNRSASHVRKALKEYEIPVVQIDEAMMEAAVDHGGKVLVVATHGPTVANTQALLKETADSLGKAVSFTGATIEEAFELLGTGDIERHNELIAEAIRNTQRTEHIDSVVLAQLSMSVFSFSYPNPQESFGIPVFTSGETGFKKVHDILLS